MTTDHVALAIINGTTPQQEAGTAAKTPLAKNSKRHFEMPETREELIARVTKIVEKELSGKIAGRGLKIGTVSMTEETKKDMYFYFTLVDSNRKEIPDYSLTPADAGEKGLEKLLIETEKLPAVAEIRPRVQLCFLANYWVGNKPKTKKAEKKTETKKTDAVNVNKLKAMPAASKVQVAAAF